MNEDNLFFNIVAAGGRAALVIMKSKPIEICTIHVGGLSFDRNQNIWILQGDSHSIDLNYLITL